MSKLGIQLESGRTSFSPGEVIRGKVTWQMGERPKTVKVQFFWYTSGKGTRDIGVVDSVTVDYPRPDGEQGFEFKVPDGPCSFSGRLISIIWAVELIVEPRDDTERVQLVISPTLQEITYDESA